MSLAVIGAGFGRTGTLSLKVALEHLGFGPCYHMAEVFGHPEFLKFWVAAAEGEAMDWDEVFEGYQATVDWPGASYWRELAECYPEAKVILSVRSPESWYESAQATIFSQENRERISGSFDGAAGGIDLRPMMRKIMVDTFDGQLDDKEQAMAVFERHTRSVIDTIPSERLLVYEAAQGWEPLCAFLGVPVPEIPYLDVNKRGDFAARFAAASEDGA